MASLTDRGHANNVANFGFIIDECKGMGETYNPSNTSIAILALDEFKSSCEHALSEVNTTLIPYKNAVNDREIEYDKMSSLATRALNALKASDVSKEIIDDATGIVRKITGRRKTAVDPENPDSISVSQMAFDSRKANFDLFIQLLAGQPAYLPNETDLTVESLNTYMTGLGSLNQNVNTTLVSLQTKRTDRNILFYSPNTGLSDISNKVKSYVKSVLGATHPTYKRIAAIRIYNYKL